VHSVASFFVSRVDTEVDGRLDKIGTPDALALQGRGALSQAKLAYQLFQERFAGERWEAWHPGAPTGNARCGPRPRQRIPPTPTPVRGRPDRSRNGQYAA